MKTTTMWNPVLLSRHRYLHLFFFVQLLLLGLLATARTPHTTDVSGRFDSLSFENGYSVIWGKTDITEDGRKVELTLDRNSGAGFMSQDNYLYGFFSAAIKLPADYTAGIVLAFYTSNGGEFPHNHDELDFEFLGNIPGRQWRMQTNIYGNGSVARGREERFNFWFDPTADFHDYSILWNHKHIIFLVDNIPIREMQRTEALGGDYPSKPMGLYATIWDGSQWATDGGKYPVDYKYAPFVASFTKLKLEGCAADPIQEGPSDLCNDLESVNPAKAADLLSLTSDQQAALEWVRSNHLYYSYCDDKSRYPVPLPECASRTSSSTSPARSKKHKSHGRRSSHTDSTPQPRGRALIESTELPLAEAESGSFSTPSEGIQLSLPTSARVPWTSTRKASGRH